MSCSGYSGCNMCNRCGKFTDLLASMGTRVCPRCKYHPESDDETVCPECGMVLPPVMAAKPGTSLEAALKAQGK